MVMSEKILVADDSSTIQKVIQITLASHSCTLVQCLNESDLFKKIKEDTFGLILLDFNLSEDKSGYDLAKHITAAAPDTPIMVMLGTFDSIDEQQFTESGIKDRVIKPFESSQFIQKCISLLESGPGAPSLEESKQTGDDWEMDAPEMPEVTEGETAIIENPLKQDPLSTEVEGWGVETDKQDEDDKENKITNPDKGDLEYPDTSKSGPSSTLISMDELEPTEKEDFEEKTIEFKMPTHKEIKEKQEPQVEVSPDEFWAVDDHNAAESTKVFSTKLDSSNNPIKDPSPQKEAPKTTTTSTSTNKDNTPREQELIEKVKESFSPLIEDLVKKYCREKVEQVAWEVIPDLAENLIQEELKELSKSVMSPQSSAQG